MIRNFRNKITRYAHKLPQNEKKTRNLNLNANPRFEIYLPFSLFSPGLFANHDLDDPKTAATQNSPPIDLLGEICGAGLVLLKEKTK